MAAIPWLLNALCENRATGSGRFLCPGCRHAIKKLYGTWCSAACMAAIHCVWKSHTVPALVYYRLMQDSLENSAEHIAQRVYQRQIDLLYRHQTLAVVATATALVLLAFFMRLSVPWQQLLPWGALFAAVLSARLLASWLYFQRQRAHRPLPHPLAEKIYFAGVVLTALVWAGMLLDVFPALDAGSKILLLLAVQGFISVSHNTMGFRRLPYFCYTLLLALPTMYVAYEAGFTHPLAIVALLLIHLLYVLHTANSFYQGYRRMLYLQQESINREHKLLLQREQASLANQAKSDFLSRMSHELRTPLNAVLGLNELQMLDQNDPLSERQRERGAKIDEAGRHLLSLVNDVLDLSRIEAGSLSLTLEPLDLQQLIRDACQLIEARVAQRQLSLRFESLPDPVWVRADARRLKQVVLNLLDNAVKYNRSGGTIAVSLRQAGESHWRMSVLDTGHGISPHGMSELFKPFARLPETQDGIDGTGIGLSFSKQLVELMHGRIGVDSRAGEGSCFWVELPRAEPRRHSMTSSEQGLQHDRHAGKHQVQTGQGRRLLLVEDNVVNQEVALEMLQEQGFEVDVADNGERALQYFQDNHYAVILMDCEMPVMDGLTATRRIRELEAQRQSAPTPVIALTAHAIQGAREKCLASGMDDFLSKPFSFDGLQACLAKWVSLPADEPQGMSQAAPQATNAAAEETAVTDTQARPAAASGFDPGAIAVLRARKPGLAARVIALYLEQSPQVLEAVEQALQQGDMEGLSHRAHTFKSSSLTVGAVAVAEICRQIEAQCEHGKVDPALAVLIREQFEVVRETLQQMLDETADTA